MKTQSEMKATRQTFPKASSSAFISSALSASRLIWSSFFSSSSLKKLFVIVLGHLLRSAASLAQTLAVLGPSAKRLEGLLEDGRALGQRDDVAASLPLGVVPHPAKFLVTAAILSPRDTALSSILRPVLRRPLPAPSFG